MNERIREFFEKLGNTVFLMVFFIVIVGLAMSCLGGFLWVVSYGLSAGWSAGS